MPLPDEAPLRLQSPIMFIIAGDSVPCGGMKVERGLDAPLRTRHPLPPRNSRCDGPCSARMVPFEPRSTPGRPEFRLMLG
jgi:hypothetical protein